MVLRAEAARTYLWDQMAYIQSAGRPALAFALAACCSLTDTDLKGIRNHLETISAIMASIYVRHELGELEDREFDRDIWRQMLADFPHTPVELLVRTLKDQLADTHPEGPLADLIARRSLAGIGFYAAFSGGWAPLLFKELKAAFNGFMESRDWSALQSAVAFSRRKAVDIIHDVLSIYRDGRDQRDLPGTQKALEETAYQHGIPRPAGN